ncbi:hypothetical protein QBC40DRAFT_170912 [Triangularia verruculosa]|uniref:Uncharacterized protein n=1 Tax=Triangularia verruculosa TaxID=2587418 RepID=A0AAN6XJ05_9PEZI|nr:hypothetical protein QBC40DRAFT_170912 [Triangularia verruculosa]
MSAACELLEGNDDLYGLGIRIGIYLQWGSAWLSLLLDPESAQGVLDACSVTLFAVTIATIIAATRNAPAIEMYIMLQILLGFPITVFSSFGLRLWLMSPRRLQKFVIQGKEVWQHKQEQRRKATQRKKLQSMEEQRRRANPLLDGLQQRSDQTSRHSKWWHKLRLVWRDYERWTQPPPLPTYVNLSNRVQRNRALFQQYRGTGSVLRGPSYVLPFDDPLTALSLLRFPGLSWSGVLWRTTIVAIIMGYNLAYWYSTDGHGVQEPPSLGCGPPTAFMFSKCLLDGSIITLGRATAVIIAVMVVPPSYALILVAIRILVYAILFLCRDIYFWVSPREPQSFKDIADKMNGVLSRHILAVGLKIESYSSINPDFIVTSLDTAVSIERSIVDLLEFMSAHGDEDSVRLTDVIKLGVSLGMGKPVKRQQAGNDVSKMGKPQIISRAQTMPIGWSIDRSTPWGMATMLKTFCVVWNLLQLGSIVWFITSIETTIRWNNIQGVNTIDSTGQLIPFVMGCVSASQVMKKVTLLALGRKYPDWVDTELEIQDSVDGPRIGAIRRAGADTVNSTPNPAAKGHAKFRRNSC